MSFIDRMHESMADYLRRHGFDAVKVTDFEEETEYGGYCSTCSYEYTVVNMTYEDSDGFSQSYKYDGYFADLLRQLT